MRRATRRLKIRHEHEDGQLRMVLSGELDIASCDSFDDALRAARASSAPTLCLDLRRLDFIDSSGLRAVLRAQAASRADDQRITLIRGPERVHRLFVLTGTADWFVFDDQGVTG